MKRDILVCLFVVGAIFSLMSCSIPAPTSGPGGGPACTDASGKQIDASTIFGKWKKQEGYTPERSPGELNLNYDIIMFEAGNKSCMIQVTNSAASKTIFRADYTNNVSDINNKKLTLNYTAGEGAPNSDTAGYKIYGDCKNLTLKIFYDNVTLKDETYVLYNKEIAPGTCSGAPSQ
jgi:hypothetical protein